MSGRTLDPRVAEILADVVRKAGGRLFHITSDQRLRQPLERTRARRSTAGLSAAERELVGVHRFELSRLLHEAFWLAVETPWRGRAIRRFFDVPERDAWRARGRSALDELPARPDLDDGLALLRGCLAASNPPRPEAPADLLLVALRLVDTENARNDIALDLVRAGETDSARRLLEGILARDPTERDAWLAWLNLGYAHALDDDRPAALSAYTRASAHACATVSTWIDAFVFALLVGDDVAATRTGAALERSSAPGDAEVAWTLAEMQRSPLAPRDLRAARLCFDRTRRSLGRVSEEVVHARF